MSYFNDDYHYYERRRGILFYIAMMLICAVVGGFVALSAAQSMGLLVAEQPQEGSETTPEINIPPAGDVTDKTAVVAIAEQVGPAVVGISNRILPVSFGRAGSGKGTGSGAFDPAGYIVTNNHVWRSKKLV